MLKLKFQYSGRPMWREDSRGQEEKEETEGDMVGWHRQLNGHAFEQAPGDGEGQGSLACCNPRGCQESDMAERLNNNRVTEREDKQNSRLPRWKTESTSTGQERLEGGSGGRGTAQGCPQGGCWTSRFRRPLCERWGRAAHPGAVAGGGTKQGKGKGQGASTSQGDSVARIQNWAGSSHGWFILWKSQRGSFPLLPTPSFRFRDFPG